jgi:AraC-like DNA-binding protein
MLLSLWALIIEVACMLDTHAQDASRKALAPLTFSSEHVEPRDALEAWRSWFGDLNEIIPAEGVPFHAKVDYWRMGSIVVGSNQSSPMRLIRTPDRARRDGLDHWVLRVSRRGVVRSRAGDRVYASRPGELLLERLADCYDDVWSADEWTALIFPPKAFPEIDRALESLGTGPVRGMRAGLLADYILALDRVLVDMTAAEVPTLAQATRALIAALSPEADGPARRSMVVARLRAERVIRANLASARLDAKRVAALSGVSRSTLYRVFEDVGGVAAHVRRLRLDAVFAALTDPERRGHTIAQIAAEAGFHCVASFNRAFKARFSASPGEVRATQGVPLQATEAATPAPDFVDCLFRRSG